MSEIELLQRRFQRERAARKEAEKLLEEKSRALFMANQELNQVALFARLNPYPVMRVNSEGILQLVNPATKALLGPHVDVGATLSSVLSCVADIDLPAIIESNGISIFDLTIGKKIIQFVVHGISQYGFANFYGSDITEKERAKLAIEKAHRDTEQMLASISSVLIEIDLEKVITRWNTVADELLGTTASEALGRALEEIEVSWQIEDIDSVLASSAREGEVYIDDVRFTRVDEKEGYLNIVVTPVKNAAGVLAGYLFLATDITKRKLLEAQLVQAQKLESLGQLAAGIAHEINTPIQFVGDNTRFLETAFKRLSGVIDTSKQMLDEIKQGNDWAHFIEEIETSIVKGKVEYMANEIPVAIEETLEGIDRVASIVSAMKQFSHPGSKEHSLSDINQAIVNTINVARNEWKYVAEIVKELDPDLPLVPCLVGELNQVFLNIIVNAAHAIEAAEGGKGTITISTRVVDEAAEIRIKDSGTGIPEAIRSKIFDPFFTTKDVGKGTGQGLSVAYNVIHDKHQGTIEIDSEIGEGTTFIIRLPLS